MAKPIPEDNEPKTDSGKIADSRSPDLGKLKINTGLVTEIASAARRLGLTQEEASRRMGIPQPKVSGMMRGDLTNLFERKLRNCLNRLWYDIEIKERTGKGSVRPSRRGGRPGKGGMLGGWLSAGRGAVC